MLIKHNEIQHEWDVMKELFDKEINKTTPTTKFIIEDLSEYMIYLDKCFLSGSFAYRPDSISRYINTPRGTYDS